MFNKLNDTSKRLIYEYDSTWKDTYNTVLEELKIKYVLKHKHKLNNYSVKEWRRQIKKQKKKNKII